MDQPNFYTGKSKLNLAVDVELFLREGYLKESDLDAIKRKIEIIHEQLRQFIKDEIPELFFHKVVLAKGHYNGYQIYIEEGCQSRTTFEKACVDSWKKSKTFLDTFGQLRTMCDCPYFRSNLQSMTYHNIALAINNEYRVLHNLVLKKAKQLKMGEVIGNCKEPFTKHPISINKI